MRYEYWIESDIPTGLDKLGPYQDKKTAMSVFLRMRRERRTIHGEEIFSGCLKSVNDSGFVKILETIPDAA